MYEIIRSLRLKLKKYNESQDCLKLDSDFIYSMTFDSSGEVSIHTKFGAFKSELMGSRFIADQVEVSALDDDTLHLKIKHEFSWVCILRRDDFKELLGEGCRESATVEELWAEWLDNECV